MTRDERQRYRDALETAAERLHEQNAEAVVWRDLIRWALGEGEGPIDVEAEEALYRFVARCEAEGPVEDQARAVRAMASGWRAELRVLAEDPEVLPLPLRAPSIGWHEAAARVEWAAAVRGVVGRVRAALRALVLGDVVEAVPLLRRALAELAEGLRRQDEARWKALEAIQ